jgi:flagellar hook assembly protein FlgD
VRAFTTIGFEVPGVAGGVHTTLRIYDSNGRLVRTVVDAMLAPKEHSVDWDGRDDHGRRVSGGVYFYRLDANGASTTKKMVVLSSNF